MSFVRSWITAFSGKNCLNSLYNWAAKVLLWLKISVGLLTCWITLAAVKVLPDPVTPNNTWCLVFEFSPSTNCLIAVGWSPVGKNSDIRLNDTG